jgi:Mg/Co/Ni transporter MgtE
MESAVKDIEYWRNFVITGNENMLTSIEKDLETCHHPKVREKLLRLRGAAQREIARLLEQKQQADALSRWAIGELRARLRGNAGDGKKDAENH